jgi:hypothetical protein
LLLSVIVREQYNSSSYFHQLPSPDIFLHDTIPPRLSRAINVLWFTSLVLALITSLFCILVKQWLSVYRVPTTAESARAWARRRQLRYDGLVTWQVPAIVALLPSLLQVALLLFLAGLVLFLWPLDRVAGSITVVLSGLLALCLLLFSILSYIFPACPYRTRFSDIIIRPVYRTLISLDRLLLDSVIIILQMVGTMLSRYLGFQLIPVHRWWFIPMAIRVRDWDNMDSQGWRRGCSTLEAEDRLISRHSYRYDAAAIQWLYTSSLDVDVLDATLVAMGSLLPFSITSTSLRSRGMYTLIVSQYKRNIGAPSNADGVSPVTKKWHLAFSGLGFGYSPPTREIIEWVDTFRPEIRNKDINRPPSDHDVDIYWSTISHDMKPILGDLFKQLHHVSERTLIRLFWTWPFDSGDIDDPLLPYEMLVLQIFNKRRASLSAYPHLLLIALNKMALYDTGPQSSPFPHRTDWLTDADKLRDRHREEDVACKLVVCPVHSM